MKRQKATIIDVLDVTDSTNHYFSHKRLKHRQHGMCSAFMMDNPLTVDQMDKLQTRWKNIGFTTIGHRFSPEQTHFTVIIYDKWIKAVTA